MSAPLEARWSAPADFPGLASLQAQASAWLDASGLDVRSINRILLALDEVAANLVRQASMSGAPEPFEVRVSWAGDVVELIVTDTGAPFDPCGVAPAPAAETLDDVQVGGLGLTLVRRLTESMRYERVNDENRLQLTFRCAPPA